MLGLLRDRLRLDVVFNADLQAGDRTRAYADALAGIKRAGERHSWHALRGLVCYTSLHYIAFFWNPREQQWSYCDDATVKEVQSAVDDVFAVHVRMRSRALTRNRAHAVCMCRVIHPPCLLFLDRELSGRGATVYTRAHDACSVGVRGRGL